MYIFYFLLFFVISFFRFTTCTLLRSPLDCLVGARRTSRAGAPARRLADSAALMACPLHRAAPPRRRSSQRRTGETALRDARALNLPPPTTSSPFFFVLALGRRNILPRPLASSRGRELERALERLFPATKMHLETWVIFFCFYFFYVSMRLLLFCVFLNIYVLRWWPDGLRLAKAETTGYSGNRASRALCIFKGVQFVIFG